MRALERDSAMQLIQVPYSHNCVKVRRALELKGLDYRTLDVPPTDRTAVRNASGQGQVPVLLDEGETIVDSTRILEHLERRSPQPSLLPEDRSLHADCWMLEDWADLGFMALTRRIAYWEICRTPGALGGLFFPRQTGWQLRLREYFAKRIVRKRFGLSAAQDREDQQELARLAAIAVARLNGQPFLFGGRVSVADIALATMSAPAWISPIAREQSHVRTLLEWGRPIVGTETLTLYGVPELASGIWL